jgi:hypothetical protein
MPSILVLRAADNPVPDSPGKWLAGEVVTNVADDHTFGFKEMPLNVWGSGVATVAVINATDPANIPQYGTVRVTDAGTITIGDDDIDVAADDVLVWQKQTGPIGNFVDYGPRNDLTSGGFYHILITDKTVEEVDIYLEAYNKKLTYQSDQFDPATDNRRFTTTNVRVSASGNNGFTEHGILDAISEWNTNHPDNTVLLNDTDNLTYFQCDGIMPNELFDEWKENTQEVALSDYYARRRWYITQQGLDSIAANNGIIQGTAEDVNPFLRDGLLD